MRALNDSCCGKLEENDHDVTDAVGRGQHGYHRATVDEMTTRSADLGTSTRLREPEIRSKREPVKMCLSL